MDSVQVEVVYALADVQVVLSVRVSAGATVAEAIEASGILASRPEIDLARQAIGIFGRQVSLARRVRQDERIEIYRPLGADPKISRRRRAAILRR